ncbi:hydroxyacid dehydrogenase [Ruania suaedae]|uniref:hydroxyacid dehydrogenase n=1 Tax=Ruania suaedae TaxID=2897774 RepID=UPI001E3D345F|nr:hydroxyacid dehydrogenase [Ruania suaedae]UFU03919.1 hydroxyacid dehydrogenase [Ruania suaedae]
MVRRLRVMLAMRSSGLAEDLLAPSTRRRLESVAEVVGPVLTDPTDGEQARALAEVDVLLTSWGAPRLDAEFLARVPRLQLVSHAAGSVKRFATSCAWAQGVRISSAADANAVAVAEYTLSMILLAGKRVFDAETYFRQERRLDWSPSQPFGNEGTTVGVVGASRIGRRVLGLLRPFSMTTLLADPTIDADQAALLGAELVSLTELMERSTVVSIHAPLLPATERLIGPAELAAMADGATLINTARGRIVDTDALLAEVGSGRLRAVLDVTDPEPLPPDHPLFEAPGVVLTPHVAGALGNELRRLGASAVAEIDQFARSGTLSHEVLPEALGAMA